MRLLQDIGLLQEVVIKRTTRLLTGRTFHAGWHDDGATVLIFGFAVFDAEVDTVIAFGLT